MFKFFKSKAKKFSPQFGILNDGRLVGSSDRSGFGSVRNLVAPAYACIDRIASRVARVKWLLVDGDGMEPSSGDFDVIKQLLANPSNRIHTSSFYRTLAEHVLVWGNAYCRKLGGSRDKHPDLLRLMLPYSVSQTVQDSNGRFRYLINEPLRNNSTNQIELSSEQVAHITAGFFNLETGFAASPLDSAGKDASGIHASAMRATSSYLKNTMKLSSVVHMDIPNLDGEESQNMMTLMKQEFAGSEQAGGTWILPFGVKYEQINHKNADMQASGYIEQATVEICRLFGIPLAAVQQTGGSRPMEDEIETAILNNAVLPLANQIASTFTRSLLTGMDRTQGYRIIPNTDYVAISARSTRVATAMQLGQTGCATINEVRKVIGLPPLPESEGSKLPKVAGAPDKPDDNKTTDEQPTSDEPAEDLEKEGDTE